MSIRIIRKGEQGCQSAVSALRERLRAGALTGGGGEDIDVPAVVAEIIAEVAERGDRAVAILTSKLDRASIPPDALLVPAEAIAAAHAAADPEFLQLIRRSAENIRQYQRHILIPDPPPVVRGGRELGVRYTPIDRVGVYVPGGRAIYPSTVLMTVVPAQVAGVGEIVLASPPSADGDIHPMVLALAGELGIAEVVRAGGAQAIAAMALGTQTIRAVSKVVGPGNAFVAEAKRQLLGRVGIDSIAGPSEVLILADASARADWLAADMLAQAEHDPGSAVLVTASAELAEKVAAEIDRQLPALDRAEAAGAGIDNYSAIIVTGDLDEACALADEFAAEHVQIVTADDRAALAKVRNAGAVFLGPRTPVPLGDYCAGPSHVLPTGGTARFFGPLSCNDFRKATSVIRYDAAALAEDTDDVIDFATREGLTAHARAVDIRRSEDY